MSELLDGSTFGDKLYNKFPAIYRNEDMDNDLFLKRYFDAIGEGGFSPAIEDVNGISKLVDPLETEDRFLPTLYESYGVTVFNGLPVKFLRGLFPYLNNLFSRKGSKSVVAYMSSILLGAKVTVEEDVDFKNNYLLHLFVDIDSRIEDDFPNTEQLEKILGFFLPFFCKFMLTYASYDKENIGISFRDSYYDVIYNTIYAPVKLRVIGDEPYEIVDGILNDPRYTLNNNFYLSTLGNIYTAIKVKDDFEDIFTKKDDRDYLSLSNARNENNKGILNSPMCSLTGNFYLSIYSGYDIITKGNEKTIVFY